MFRFRVADDKKDENQPDEQQNQQPQQQPPQENLTAEEMRQRRLQALSRFSSPKHPSDQSTSSPSNKKHESPPKRQKLDDAMEIDEEISTTTTPVKVQQQTPPVKQSPSSDTPKKKITLQEKFEHEILQRVVNPPPLPMKIFPNAERFVFDIHAEVLIFEKLKTLKTGQDVLLFINRAFMMSEDELSRENARKEKSKPERVSVLTRLSELLLNYLVLFVSESQSFIASPLTSDALLQILLDEDNPNNALDEKILAKLVTIETESTKQLWENILEQMSQRFAKFDMLERYFPYLLVLNRLLRYKEIAIIMVNHPKWLPSVKSGALMESGTILGPFFRLSAYFDHPKVGEQFFGNGQLNGMTQKDLDFKRQTLRSEIKMYQDTLHKIFMNLVRPKETRNKAVEWLQTVLVGNKSRLKMHEDIYSSSSESFLTNYCALVLKLCEPFLAAEANKYRTIDADYPMLNTAISFKDDTHINATEAEAKELYANETGTREWSFVTECFFICYRALKIGFIKTLEKYHHVLQSYHEIRRELKRIPKEDPRHAQGEKELANMLMIMVTAEVHILDPGYHRCILQFYRFASKFLLYTAAPDKTNEDQLITNAADKEKIPRAFKCLSEFMILDTIEFSKFALTRSVESFAAGEELEQILTMLITFTRYDHYIKNPYVRAKVPDLYTTLIPKSFRDNQRDTDLPMAIENLLIKHKASQEHLMAAFIDLYIDMEHTGSSHQFYEKFTPRYFIALLFKYLWQFPIYRNAFVQETNQNSQFVKFFNLMLNDATFLLDESLKILTDIRNYEQEWDEETQTGTRPSDQQMQGRARQEQQLRGNMQLARETVHMMTYLSKDVPQPFLRPEMVQRVASMLNYFLVELAGPQCQNLKVKNPEKYFFNPKELLSEITDTFINFSGFDEFVHAVATDSRSFKPEIFERVVGILRKIGTRPETSIRKFQAFSLKAMEVAQQTITEEEDLGEVPDEFLDPITYTLMEDPVLLPASQIFIDRSTIERHLLNDQTDPFNRSHLTQDMLLPGTEMKDKIREWKESAKKK